METKNLPGGKIWTKRPFGRDSYAYTSHCGRHDIVPLLNGKCVLISMDFEDIDSEPVRARFETIEAAMRWADRM